jgi:hypothetical protein
VSNSPLTASADSARSYLRLTKQLHRAEIMARIAKIKLPACINGSAALQRMAHASPPLPLQSLRNLDE